MKQDNDAHVADLRRRLRNARQRAAYWSGRPNFSNRGFRGNSCHGDEGYEIAMCDIRSLSGAIEEATGKRPKQSDPKREFRATFSALMGAHHSLKSTK